jgi:hypothetical protein
MAGYHDAALLSGHDVQARGGGGAAERLHASGRQLAAAAQVEIGERRAGTARCTGLQVAAFTYKRDSTSV